MGRYFIPRGQTRPDRRRLALGFEALEERRLLTLTYVSGTTAEPWRWIADVDYVQPGSIGNCSGALVSPFHILTAAHCIYSSLDDDGFLDRDNFEIRLARDAAEEPYGVASATRLRVLSGFADDGDDEDDMGLITLDRALGHFAGHFDMAALASDELDGSLNLAGYPSAGTYSGYELYRSFGPVENVRANTIQYRPSEGLEGVGGHSGAPLWRLRDGNRVLVGVHALSYANDLDQATRLTSGRLDVWNERIAADVRPDVADAVEPNNSRSAATRLASPSDRRDNLTIHAANNDDYFKFTAYGTGNTIISAYFIDAVGDVDLALLDDAGNELARSSSTDDDERINWHVTQNSEYYIRVYGYEGDLHPNYSLAVDGPSPLPDYLEPNNSVATNLGVGRAALHGLTIHNTSDHDLFRWTAPSDGAVTVDVRFSHVLGDIDVELLDANFNVIDSSSSINDDETLSWTARQGEQFFIHVFGYGGAMHPNYSFLLNGPPVPGDTNADFLVDLTDLNNVRNNFGGVGLGDTAPFDGDVDLDDLNLVRNNFGGAPVAPSPDHGLIHETAGERLVRSRKSEMVDLHQATRRLEGAGVDELLDEVIFDDEAVPAKSRLSRATSSYPASNRDSGRVPAPFVRSSAEHSSGMRLDAVSVRRIGAAFDVLFALTGGDRPHHLRKNR